MTVKLRLSSKDGRARQLGAPYCLIDRDTNGLVSTHSNHASALRAMVTLQNVGSNASAWGLSVEALAEITADVCEKQYRTRGFDQLSGVKQAQLIAAVHRELRSQGR